MPAAHAAARPASDEQHEMCVFQAALDHSLALKRVEAGVKTLVLWGKIIALNGKVRLAAQAAPPKQRHVC